MYAIVKTGGKQYRVAEGDKIKIEKTEGEVGSTIDLDQVLVIAKDDGETIFGTPVIPGAHVVAKVLEHGKADKILVFKYKSKANYRRRYGHRQPYTEVKVEKIELGATKAAKASMEIADEGSAIEKAPAEKKKRAPRATTKAAKGAEESKE